MDIPSTNNSQPRIFQHKRGRVVKVQYGRAVVLLLGFLNAVITNGREMRVSLFPIFIIFLNLFFEIARKDVFIVF